MTLKSIRRGKVHQLSLETLSPVYVLEVMPRLEQGWDFSPRVGNLSPTGAWHRAVGGAVPWGWRVGEAAVLAPWTGHFSG